MAAVNNTHFGGDGKKKGEEAFAARFRFFNHSMDKMMCVIVICI